MPPRKRKAETTAAKPAATAATAAGGNDDDDDGIPTADVMCRATAKKRKGPSIDTYIRSVFRSLGKALEESARAGCLSIEITARVDDSHPVGSMYKFRSVKIGEWWLSVPINYDIHELVRRITDKLSTKSHNGCVFIVEQEEYTDRSFHVLWSKADAAVVTNVSSSSSSTAAAAAVPSPNPASPVASTTTAAAAATQAPAQTPPPATAAAASAAVTFVVPTSASLVAARAAADTKANSIRSRYFTQNVVTAIADAAEKTAAAGYGQINIVPYTAGCASARGRSVGTVHIHVELPNWQLVVPVGESDEDVFDKVHNAFRATPPLGYIVTLAGDRVVLRWRSAQA